MTVTASSLLLLIFLLPLVGLPLFIGTRCYVLEFASFPFAITIIMILLLLVPILCSVLLSLLPTSLYYKATSAGGGDDQLW